VTCSFDGTDCYKARVLPLIKSVSKNSGYITGGQEITIKGQGFKHGAVVTNIDGVQCTEVKKTDYEFVCLTGSASKVSDTKTDKAGQHGSLRSFWNRENGGNYFALDNVKHNRAPKNTTLWLNTEFP